MSNSIRIMTYNIHSGVGTDRRADWKRIADVIKNEDPDLLGLEEVCRFRPFAPDIDIPALFSDYLAMDVRFAKSFAPGDASWEYGNAIASKTPFELVDIVHFDIPEGEEPRVFAVGKTVINGNSIYLFVCHVPFDGEMENDTQIRVNCFRKLTEYMISNHYYPAILTGDFNSYAGTVPIDYVHEHFDVVNDLDPATPTSYCSMGAGWQQIDFICTYPKGTFKVNSLKFVENLLASDHRPVVAELSYNG